MDPLGREEREWIKEKGERRKEGSSSSDLNKKKKGKIDILMNKIEEYLLSFSNIFPSYVHNWLGQEVETDHSLQ